MTVVLCGSVVCLAAGVLLGGIGLYRVNRAFRRIDKVKEKA